jgi:presenilin-like A22 family membrane protease
MVIVAMSSQSGRKAQANVIVTHPNRRKPAVRATRMVVVLLLLASAALVLIVMVGGWRSLQGDVPVLVAYVGVYLAMALLAVRWNRGVLPLAAVLALLLLIFAGVSAPAWFARDKNGFAQPDLNAGLLGVVTLAIIPVQLLLIAFAMRGFSQGWNVELEQLAPGPSEHALRGPA